MNIANIKTTEKEINWSDVIWDLLEQWKAILITALAVMVVVAGAKYAKDMKAYKTGQKEKEVMKAVSAEERTEMILQDLPEKERAAVMTVINQNEMLESEMEYLNSSVLMKTDPTNQRMLVMDYYISGDGLPESSTTSLIYAYRSRLGSDSAAEKIGEAIDPGLEKRYVAELISVNDADPEDMPDAYGAGMRVRIVLPEEADCEKVEAAVTDIIRGHSAEVSSKIGPHDAVLLNAEELRRYDAETVRKRNLILRSIENMQGSNKNMQTRMSEGQKVAVEAVTAANEEFSDAAGKAADESRKAEDQKSEKPAVSRKYAFLGLMLGAMLYAFIYVVNYIVKKRICSAGDVEYYTQSRLLGEIYHRVRHKGLDALLHSRLVDKYRYRGKLDEDVQVQRAASKLDTVCRHTGAKAVSLLCMSKLPDVKEKTAEAIRAKGLDVQITEIPEQKDDEYLLSLKDAVILAEDGISSDEVVSLTAQLTDYGANLLGSLYCSCI